MKEVTMKMLTVVVIAIIFGIAFQKAGDNMANSWNNTADEIIAIYDEAAERKQKIVEQAEECINAGWEVSLDGNVIEGAVDLSCYYVKIDEEKQVVILTTPRSSSNRSRSSGVSYIPYPIHISD